MVHGCICNWTECKEWQKYLKEINHPLAGYARIQRDTKNYKTYLLCVLDSVKNRDRSKTNELFENQKSIRIAYFHFPESGLEFLNFKSKNPKWTKGVPIETKTKYGISPGEGGKCFEFTSSTGTMTFIRPNRPRGEVRAMIDTLKESAKLKKRKKEVTREVNILHAPKKKKPNESQREFLTRKIDSVRLGAAAFVHACDNEGVSLRAARAQVRSSNNDQRYEASRRLFQEKEKEIALHAEILEDEKEKKILACKELMKETGLMSESEKSQKQCQEISAKYEELVQRKDLEIEQLKAEKRALIEKVKYRDQLVEKAKAKASAPIATSVHIQTALVAVGGLTHFTIISDQFHQQNPEFCKTFLGFINYNEAKIYINVHFQVIPHELCYDEKTASFPSMSDYEQIVLTKLFMESICHRSRLAEIYNLDRTRVGRIITKWAPRWGKFGERLSILPVPHDYFHKESPIEYDALGLEEVSVLFDGKDTLTESIRKDSSLNRRQQSSKMKAAAMRYLNFSTPAGLSVHTVQDHLKLRI